MSTLTTAQRDQLVTRTKLIANITGTAEDALLAILVDDIWAKMENQLGREVLSNSIDELVDIGEDGIGVLLNPDVSGIGFVGTSFESAFELSYSGTGLTATVEVTDVSVILRTIDSAGVTTTTTATFASNASVTAMVATLDAVTGWTATEVNNGDTSLLERRGVRLVTTSTTTLRRWEEYAGEYRANYKIGALDFFDDLAYDHGFPYNRIRVKYDAGFATIPDDVELEIILAAKAAWNLKDKDMAVKAEKLGDYSYSLASLVAIDPSDNLGKYRRVSI